MSVRPADPSPARNGPVGENVAPPPPAREQSKPGQLANIGASGQPRRRAPNKAPRRNVVRRRGARVDSESENDDTARSATVSSGQVRRTSDSDSDLDLDPPSSSDDDDDDDGAVEPRTPATASVEQLPATADTSTPRYPLKSRKAVLAGQGLHPSWADMPAPGEDGDTSLPTLDFSNLSLDVVRHLPSPGPTPRPPPVAARASASGEQQLSKKQLKGQRRQAKLATLAAKDPQEADRLAKEREEREAAKRLAKKERQKAKKKERKLLFKSTGSGDLLGTTESADNAKPVSPAAASPSPLPPPIADQSVSNKDAKQSKFPKKAPTPVPSRPSRTAVALGLGNADIASPTATASPALPPTASATAPVVPSAQRQPAFLPRDAQGRPVTQNEAPASARSRRGLEAAEGTADHWTRGRGGSVRGFGSYRGRGTGRYSAHERDDRVAEIVDDAWAVDASQRGEGLVRGRGRGRGRGALAGRGRVTGPPGAINPRYAHLPFHPLHRFPSPAGPAQVDIQSTSKRSETRSEMAEPSGPEVTTSASEEQLFAPVQATPRARSRQDDNVVKLPERSSKALSLTIKGVASATQASTQRSSSREPRPANGDSGPERGGEQVYLSDPGILYASAPSSSETAPPGKEAESEIEDRHKSLDSLQQVPPHLQDGPSPEPQPTGTVYYQQQQQFPLAYWSTGNGAGEQYPISTPSPAPASVSPPPFGAAAAHPPPSSAYFVPPRASRRVEIKPPSSRDGQSPAPPLSAKTAPQPPVDALEAARGIRDAQLLQQQEHQRQAEAAYLQAASYGFAPQPHFPPPPPMSNLPASPTIGRPPQHAHNADFARDAFPIPANAPLPGAHVVHQPAPLPQQVYSPYQQIPPTTDELVAPYPSYYPAAAAYYAPQPMYQQTFSPAPNGVAGYAGMYVPQPPTQDAHSVGFDDPHRQWQGY